MPQAANNRQMWDQKSVYDADNNFNSPNQKRFLSLQQSRYNTVSQRNLFEGARPSKKFKFNELDNAVLTKILTVTFLFVWIWIM